MPARCLKLTLVTFQPRGTSGTAQLEAIPQGIQSTIPGVLDALGEV
jgi:hypothetical protein